MRTLIALSLLGGLVAGCATEVPPEKGELADLVFHDADSSADRFSRRVDLRGSIGFGQTVEGTYSETGYSGYEFVGHAGAEIAVSLDGVGNDPVLYVYGPKQGDSWDRVRRIARNDDYHGYDSYAEATLPEDGTYLVIAREYWGEPGSFRLTLDCAGADCRLECGADGSRDECPNGAACDRVVCITTPCPSYCAPDSAPPTGQVCGTRGAGPCPDGQFCNWPESAICGAADAPGTCEDIPTLCTREFAPVCGCNGETYGNACGAHAAGVSVAHQGECRGPDECDPRECGPEPLLPNGMCEDGSWSGPTGRCLRNDDGTCGWEIRSCPPPEPACVTAGCSSQLCVEEGGDPIFTTCEWREEYACLRDSRCERQPSGECGWTETPEYQMCMDDLRNDCRTTGCGAGEYCTYCWVGFACIPEGAVC